MKPTSFPRLLTAFTLKPLSDGNSADAAMTMSPTSILDSKPSSVFRNPFWSDSSTAPKTPQPEPEPKHKLQPEKIGLRILDTLDDDDSGSNISKPETRMVLFGSQLRIQIPPSASSPAASPRTPPEFGIKTRNSQMGSFSSGLSPLSPCPAGFGSENSGMESLNSPRVLSATDMELSEDYTCVICRGPNPRTTHIFDNCIVESREVVEISPPRKEFCFLGSCSENFLSSCYTCKKNLGQGKDIYMYRGEKAFCSRECRYQEMILEEEIDNLEADGVYGAL